MTMEENLELKKPLRLRYIERVDDLLSALDLCGTYDIPDDSLMDLDDYKDRMRTHYNSKKHGNFKQKVRKKPLIKPLSDLNLVITTILCSKYWLSHIS